MAAVEGRPPPLLNPVLALRKEPVPESAPVGGQGEAGVIKERLEKQRAVLSASCRQISARASDLAPHAGKLHLVARMFSDSFAPTWIPRGLFKPDRGWRLVAPSRGGYLVEAEVSRLLSLAKYIETANSIEARTAISRIRSITPFDGLALLRGRSLDQVWATADEVEGGKGFILWLAPFADPEAKDSVVQALESVESGGLVISTYPQVRLMGEGSSEQRISLPRGADQTSIARAARRYRNGVTARAFVALPSKVALATIVASGTSYRIDPVRRVEATAPGIGAEPGPPKPNPDAQPIVAIVDGGLTARSYQSLEAWRAPPFVKDGLADHAHGNRVTSLVVHAHAWNNRLALPTLECRFGTIQAVPQPARNRAYDLEQLIAYLREVAHRFPDARVWNFSFNQILPEDDTDAVSYLGHEISTLARENDLLPIISIGNRDAANPNHRLCPPADCEAALTVAGRESDSGQPAGPCPVSLLGPGPDGMLKPDLSWFSRLRTIGGGAPSVGSSYAAPLVASLAAHTYSNLKDPSPDLVRALLIDRAELDSHSHSLGWGTPWGGHPPWVCAPGSVTMAWRAALQPGYAYYWNDIPIPPELVRQGKLFGKARLTAILKPIVSELGGPNYFVTRLQVALQYSKVDGSANNLLGSMREDKERELVARSELAKWHPVRRHKRDFSKRGGIRFSGDTMRLHARIFARDLFQFGLASQQELGEQDVAFVLTFCDGTDSSSIYNSTTQILGNFVESAVLDQEINLDASPGED